MTIDIIIGASVLFCSLVGFLMWKVTHGEDRSGPEWMTGPHGLKILTTASVRSWITKDHCDAWVAFLEHYWSSHLGGDRLPQIRQLIGSWVVEFRDGEKMPNPSGGWARGLTWVDRNLSLIVDTPREGEEAPMLCGSLFIHELSHGIAWHVGQIPLPDHHQWFAEHQLGH